MSTYSQTLTWYTRNAEQFEKGALACDTPEDLVTFAQKLKGDKLLDAGCGVGRDMITFKNLGFNVTGLEPTPALATKTRQRTNLPVRTRNLAHPIQDSWDGIWCLAVLVHIPLQDWEAAISNIWNALAPGGWAYISVKEGNTGAYTDSQGRPLTLVSHADLETLVSKVTSNHMITKLDAKTSTGTLVPWLNIWLHKDS